MNGITTQPLKGEGAQCQNTSCVCINLEMILIFGSWGVESLQFICYLSLVIGYFKFPFLHLAFRTLMKGAFDERGIPIHPLHGGPVPPPYR